MTVGCTTAQEKSNLVTKEPVTVIIVRHAEKMLDAGDNPALTEIGQERAVKLAEMLRNVEISAIYSTPYLRNTMTVEEVATNQNVAIQEYDPKKGDDLMKSIVAEYSGKTVLVCGHSNSSPMLVNTLTGLGLEKLDESDYGNFYVVTTSEFGKGELLHLTY
jgi:broad specificity phosphatase PhoE